MSKEKAEKYRKSKLYEAIGKNKFEQKAEDGQEGETYDAAEVKSELRAGNSDTVEDRVSIFQDLANKGKQSFNNKAKSLLSDRYGVDFSKYDSIRSGNTEDTKEDTTDTSKTSDTSETTDNTESKTNYTPKSFPKWGNINSMSGLSKKMATYGAGTGVASDSGLGGADFVNYFANASNSSQKSDAEFADKVMADADKQIEASDVVDTKELRTSISRDIQDDMDKAYLSKVMNFGDIFNSSYKPSKWKHSAPDEVEQPNWKKMYDDLAGNIG